MLPNCIRDTVGSRHTVVTFHNQIIPGGVIELPIGVQGGLEGLNERLYVLPELTVDGGGLEYLRPVIPKKMSSLRK